MKYTDKLFKFPTRLADEEQMLEIAQLAQKGEDTSDIVLRTIDSIRRLPVIEGDLTWSEYYPPEVKFEDIHKEGFTTTMIVSEKFGDFLCSWPIKKFEEELNKHMEKISGNNV